MSEQNSFWLCVAGWQLKVQIPGFLAIVLSFLLRCFVSLCCRSPVLRSTAMTAGSQAQACCLTSITSSTLCGFECQRQLLRWRGRERGRESGKLHPAPALRAPPSDRWGRCCQVTGSSEFKGFVERVNADKRGDCKSWCLYAVVLITSLSIHRVPEGWQEIGER